MNITPLDVVIEDVESTVPGRIVRIAHFNGQLDSTNLDEKRKVIDELLKRYPKNLHIIFDFDQLLYLNSMALGYLAEFVDIIVNSGGKCVIARPRPNVLDIFKVIGFTQFIKTYPTIEEARLEILK